MVELERKQKRKRVSFSVPEEPAALEDDGLTTLQKSLHVVVEGDSDSESLGSDEPVETSFDGERESDSSDAHSSAGSSSSSSDSDSEKDDEKTNADKKPLGGGSAGESDNDVSGDDDDAGTTSIGDSTLKDSADGSASYPTIESFAEMHLDQRVSWAVARLGWRRPTAVQKCAIPAALGGRDLIVSAPTGSGKTAAYAIPLVNHICEAEAARGHTPANGTCALVLVPTRELAAQVSGQLRKLLKFVDGVHVATLSSLRLSSSRNKQPKSARKGPSADAPATEPPTSSSFARTAEVLVGTPAAVIAFHREHGDVALSNITFVVIDEADLVLSYGHGADVHAALSAVPSTAQAVLVSATLEAEGMPELRKVVLRHPLIVKVAGTTGDDMAIGGHGQGASHYYAKLGSSVDRFLVTYAMLRLNVISGKVLVFTNSVNAAFRLKLFLDQFKLKSAVLNSELPANSRIHCVEQFNAGIFDILIATDEIRRDDAEEGLGKKMSSEPDEVDQDTVGAGVQGDDDDGESVEKLKKGKKEKRSSKKVKGDVEFGVARGVDFRGVAAVINFDTPESDIAYTHRAGRTARAGASGTVLSLVVSDHELASVVNMGQASQAHVGPLSFRMDQIEAFRYRVEDCLRSVTDTAVHDARLSDVRREMINSDRLKDYFEDNPMDLDALKHDGLLAKHIPEHLARVPAYLLPPALRGAIPNETLMGGRPRPKRRNFMVSGKRGGDKNGGDPLKTFSASRRNSGSSRDRYQARHGIHKKSSSRTGSAKRGRTR
jgi:ATP-dependent RNA helicase DDX56/DBP9